MKRAEWEQAVILAAIVERLDGEVTIPVNEIVALWDTTIEVAELSDHIIVRVRRRKPDLLAAGASDQGC